MGLLRFNDFSEYWKTLSGIIVNNCLTISPRAQETNVILAVHLLVIILTIVITMNWQGHITTERDQDRMDDRVYVI